MINRYETDMPLYSSGARLLAKLQITESKRSHSRVKAISCALSSVLVFTCALFALSAQAAATSTSTANISVATQLKEVHRGTIDGRDYLTLHIGGHDVGPSTCRGNILRMDTSGEAGAQRQKEIEAIALSAMLTSATVMIVVPLDLDQCVDGKPTFTDLFAIEARL